MRKLKRFALSLLAFSLPSFAVTLEDVNHAHKAIQSQLYSADPLNTLDINELQKHIDTLETATREIEFDAANFAIILNAQLSAAELINKKYHFNGEPIDVSQVQDFLDDLDTLSEVTDIKLNNLQYNAGHIAAHQLQNKGLAYRYWSECGINGHAGCMNILATSYESGEFVVEKDFHKAVTWHKRVVATGTRWNCAGVYSSLRLAILSSSGVETHKPTEHWLEQVTLLREQRIEEKGDPNVCSPDMEYIAHYTMSGFGQKWLDKLASINMNEDNITRSGRASWIADFDKAQSLNVLIPTLDLMYDDARRCSAIEEFALKNKGNKVELDLIHSYISNLDPEHCAPNQATVIRLLNLAAQ